MNKYRKHLKKYNSLIRKRNEKDKKKSYFDRLLARIFISSVILLLILCLDFLKITRFNSTTIRNELYQQTNILSLVKLFNGTFGSFFPIENEDPVFSATVYDYVAFDDKVNEVINYDFDGVTNLVEGIIMKVSRDENSRYEITVKGADSFEYIYGNLESIDVSIYQYVTKNRILGKAPRTSGGYAFNLMIMKDQVYYDFHDQSQD